MPVSMLGRHRAVKQVRSRAVVKLQYRANIEIILARCEDDIFKAWDIRIGMAAYADIAQCGGIIFDRCKYDNIFCPDVNILRGHLTQYRSSSTCAQQTKSTLLTLMFKSGVLNRNVSWATYRLSRCVSRISIDTFNIAASVTWSIYDAAFTGMASNLPV